MRIFCRSSLFRFFIAASFIFTLAAAARAQSQTQATLTGAVVDASGAGIAGARVVATQSGQNKSAGETVTGANGRFTLSLAAGKYKISVAHEAFAPGQTQIELAAGQTRDLRIPLELEPLSASVVVTAAAEPEASVAASTPVSILTRDDIQNEQPTSLVPLLASQPGVTFARLGREGGATDLFLDGGNSNFTKVLIDGVPVNEPGGYLDFSNFSLDDVDKIEVVHGAESALFGSDAVDGAVQIFTHRGTTRTPELNLESEGGTFSTGHGTADVLGRTRRVRLFRGRRVLRHRRTESERRLPQSHAQRQFRLSHRRARHASPRASRYLQQRRRAGPNAFHAARPSRARHSAQFCRRPRVGLRDRFPLGASRVVR